MSLFFFYMNSFLLSLTGISFICICILFVMFIIFPALRSHPGGFIMLAALFQAYWLFYLILEYGMLTNTPNYICIFLPFHCSNHLLTIYSLIQKLITDFVTNGAHFYEMILCLDLALAMYMPLYTPQKRSKYYHIAFLVHSAIYFSVHSMTISQDSIEIYLKDEAYKLNRYDGIFIVFSDTCFFLISFFSVIYFWTKIKKGRRDINSLLKRYLYYGILFSIHILLFGILVFYRTFNSYDLPFGFITQFYITIEFIALFILRCTEPYTFKYMMYNHKLYINKVPTKGKALSLKLHKTREWLTNTPSLFMVNQKTYSVQVHKYIYIYILYAILACKIYASRPIYYYSDSN